MQNKTNNTFTRVSLAMSLVASACMLGACAVQRPTAEESPVPVDNSAVSLAPNSSVTTNEIQLESPKPVPTPAPRQVQVPAQPAPQAKTEVIIAPTSLEKSPEYVEYQKQAEHANLAFRSLCVAPKYEEFFNKTACFAKDITVAQRNDTSRITNAQRMMATEIFAKQRAINEETRAYMARTRAPNLLEATSISRYVLDPALEGLQTDLIDGKITWGEFNARRQALLQSEPAMHSENALIN